MRTRTQNPLPPFLFYSGGGTHPTSLSYLESRIECWRPPRAQLRLLYPTCTSTLSLSPSITWLFLTVCHILSVCVTGEPTNKKSLTWAGRLAVTLSRMDGRTGGRAVFWGFFASCSSVWCTRTRCGVLGCVFFFFGGGAGVVSGEREGKKVGEVGRGVGCLLLIIVYYVTECLRADSCT